MGKVLEALQAKLNELRQREQAPAPDYQADPKAAMDYIKSRNAVDYEQTAATKALIRALWKLPRNKQEEFYDRCVLPAAQNGFTKANFFEHMDQNSYIGQNHIKWIMQDGTYGQDWKKSIDVLEELIGPEAADELADEIGNTIDP